MGDDLDLGAHQAWMRQVQEITAEYVGLQQALIEEIEPYAANFSQLATGSADTAPDDAAVQELGRRLGLAPTAAEVDPKQVWERFRLTADIFVADPRNPQPITFEQFAGVQALLAATVAIATAAGRQIDPADPPAYELEWLAQQVAQRAVDAVPQDWLADLAMAAYALDTPDPKRLITVESLREQLRAAKRATLTGLVGAQVEAVGVVVALISGDGLAPVADGLAAEANRLPGELDALAERLAAWADIGAAVDDLQAAAAELHARAKDLATAVAAARRDLRRLAGLPAGAELTTARLQQLARHLGILDAGQALDAAAVRRLLNLDVLTPTIHETTAGATVEPDDFTGVQLLAGLVADGEGIDLGDVTPAHLAGLARHVYRLDDDPGARLGRLAELARGALAVVRAGQDLTVGNLRLQQLQAQLPPGAQADLAALAMATGAGPLTAAQLRDFGAVAGLGDSAANVDPERVVNLVRLQHELVAGTSTPPSRTLLTGLGRLTAELDRDPKLSDLADVVAELTGIAAPVVTPGIVLDVAALIGALTGEVAAVTAAAAARNYVADVATADANALVAVFDAARGRLAADQATELGDRLQQLRTRLTQAVTEVRRADQPLREQTAALHGLRALVEEIRDLVRGAQAMAPGGTGAPTGTPTGTARVALAPVNDPWLLSANLSELARPDGGGARWRDLVELGQRLDPDAGLSAAAVANLVTLARALTVESTATPTGRRMVTEEHLVATLELVRALELDPATATPADLTTVANGIDRQVYGLLGAAVPKQSALIRLGRALAAALANPELVALTRDALVLAEVSSWLEARFADPRGRIADAGQAVAAAVAGTGLEALAEQVEAEAQVLREEAAGLAAAIVAGESSTAALSLLVARYEVLAARAELLRANAISALLTVRALTGVEAGPIPAAAVQNLAAELELAGADAQIDPEPLVNLIALAAEAAPGEEITTDLLRGLAQLSAIAAADQRNSALGRSRLRSAFRLPDLDALWQETTRRPRSDIQPADRLELITAAGRLENGRVDPASLRREVRLAELDRLITQPGPGAGLQDPPGRLSIAPTALQEKYRQAAAQLAARVDEVTAAAGQEADLLEHRRLLAEIRAIDRDYRALDGRIRADLQRIEGALYTLAGAGAGEAATDEQLAALAQEVAGAEADVPQLVQLFQLSLDLLAHLRADPAEVADLVQKSGLPVLHSLAAVIGVTGPLTIEAVRAFVRRIDGLSPEAGVSPDRLLQLVATINEMRAEGGEITAAAVIRRELRQTVRADILRTKSAIRWLNANGSPVLGGQLEARGAELTDQRTAIAEALAAGADQAEQIAQLRRASAELGDRANRLAESSIVALGDLVRLAGSVSAPPLNELAYGQVARRAGVIAADAELDPAAGERLINLIDVARRIYPPRLGQPLTWAQLINVRLLDDAIRASRPDEAARLQYGVPLADLQEVAAAFIGLPAGSSATPAAELASLADAAGRLAAEHGTVSLAALRVDAWQRFRTDVLNTTGEPEAGSALQQKANAAVTAGDAAEDTAAQHIATWALYEYREAVRREAGGADTAPTDVADPLLVARNLNLLVHPDGDAAASQAELAALGRELSPTVPVPVDTLIHLLGLARQLFLDPDAFAADWSASVGREEVQATLRLARAVGRDLAETTLADLRALAGAVDAAVDPAGGPHPAPTPPRWRELADSATASPTAGPRQQRAALVTAQLRRRYGRFDDVTGLVAELNRAGLNGAAAPLIEAMAGIDAALAGITPQLAADAATTDQVLAVHAQRAALTKAAMLLRGTLADLTALTGLDPAGPHVGAELAALARDVGVLDPAGYLTESEELRLVNLVRLAREAYGLTPDERVTRGHLTAVRLVADALREAAESGDRDRLALDLQLADLDGLVRQLDARPPTFAVGQARRISVLSAAQAAAVDGRLTLAALRSEHRDQAAADLIDQVGPGSPAHEQFVNDLTQLRELGRGRRADRRQRALGRMLAAIASHREQAGQAQDHQQWMQELRKLAAKAGSRLDRPRTRMIAAARVRFQAATGQPAPAGFDWPHARAMHALDRLATGDGAGIATEEQLAALSERIGLHNQDPAGDKWLHRRSEASRRRLVQVAVLAAQLTEATGEVITLELLTDVRRLIDAIRNDPGMGREVRDGVTLPHVTMAVRRFAGADLIGAAGVSDGDRRHLLDLVRQAKELKRGRRREVTLADLRAGWSRAAAAMTAQAEWLAGDIEGLNTVYEEVAAGLPEHRRAELDAIRGRLRTELEALLDGGWLPAQQDRLAQVSAIAVAWTDLIVLAGRAADASAPDVFTVPDYMLGPRQLIGLAGMFRVDGAERVREAMRELLGGDLTAAAERDLLATITEQHLQASMATLVSGGKTFYFGDTEITLRAELHNPRFAPDDTRVRVDNTSQSWSQLQGTATVTKSADAGVGGSGSLGLGVDKAARSVFMNLGVRGSSRDRSAVTTGATLHSSMNSKSVDITRAFRWTASFTLTMRRKGEDPIAPPVTAPRVVTGSVTTRIPEHQTPPRPDAATLGASDPETTLERLAEREAAIRANADRLAGRAPFAPDGYFVTDAVRGTAELFDAAAAMLRDAGASGLVLVGTEARAALRNWLQTEMLRANFHLIARGEYRPAPLTLHTRLPGGVGDGPSAVLKVRAKVRNLRFVAGGRGTALERVMRGQVRVEDSRTHTDGVEGGIGGGVTFVKSEGREQGLGSYWAFGGQGIFRGGLSAAESTATGGTALTGRGHRFEGDTGVWVGDVVYELAGLVTHPQLHGVGTRSVTTPIPPTPVEVPNGTLLRYPRDEAVVQGLLTEDEATAIFGPPPDPVETLPGPRRPPPYLANGEAVGVSFAEEIRTTAADGSGLVEQIKALVRQRAPGFLPPQDPTGIRQQVPKDTAGNLILIESGFSTDKLLSRYENLPGTGVSVVLDHPDGDQRLEVVVKAQLTNPRYVGTNTLRTRVLNQTQRKAETSVRVNTTKDLGFKGVVRAPLGTSTTSRAVQPGGGFRNVWAKSVTLLSGLTAKFARNSTSPEPMAGFQYDVTYVIETHHVRRPNRILDVAGALSRLRGARRDVHPDPVLVQVPNGMTIRVPETLTTAADEAPALPPPSEVMISAPLPAEPRKRTDSGVALDDLDILDEPKTDADAIGAAGETAPLDSARAQHRRLFGEPPGDFGPAHARALQALSYLATGRRGKPATVAQVARVFARMGVRGRPWLTPGRHDPAYLASGFSMVLLAVQLAEPAGEPVGLDLLKNVRRIADALRRPPPPGPVAQVTMADLIAFIRERADAVGDNRPVTAVERRHLVDLVAQVRAAKGSRHVVTRADLTLAWTAAHAGVTERAQRLGEQAAASLAAYEERSPEQRRPESDEVRDRIQAVVDEVVPGLWRPGEQDRMARLEQAVARARDLAAGRRVDPAELTGDARAANQPFRLPGLHVVEALTQHAALATATERAFAATLKGAFPDAEHTALSADGLQARDPRLFPGIGQVRDVLRSMYSSEFMRANFEQMTRGRGHTKFDLFSDGQLADLRGAVTIKAKIRRPRRLPEHDSDQIMIDLAMQGTVKAESARTRTETGELGGEIAASWRTQPNHVQTTTSKLSGGSHSLSSAVASGAGGNATGERVAFFQGGPSQLYVGDVEYEVTTKLSRRFLLSGVLPKSARRALKIAGRPQTVTVSVADGVYFRLDAEKANELGIDGEEQQPRPDPEASRQRRYLPKWLARGRMIGHAAVEDVGDVEQVLDAVEAAVRGASDMSPAAADKVMFQLRNTATALSTNGVRAFIDSLTNGGLPTLVVDDTPTGKRYVQVVLRAKLSRPRWRGFAPFLRVETAGEAALKTERSGARTVTNAVGATVPSGFAVPGRVAMRLFKAALRTAGVGFSYGGSKEKSFTTTVATNPTVKRISVGPRKSHRFLMDVDYHVSIHTSDKPPRLARAATGGLAHAMFHHKTTTSLPPIHQDDGVTLLVPEGLVAATPQAADPDVPEPQPVLALTPGDPPPARVPLPTPHNVDGVANVADLRAAAMLALSADAQLPSDAEVGAGVRDFGRRRMITPDIDEVREPRLRAWLTKGAPGHSVLLGNGSVTQDALGNLISAEFLKANFGLFTKGGLESADLINDHHAIRLKAAGLKISARLERAEHLQETDEFGMDHVLQAGVRQENTHTEGEGTRIGAAGYYPIGVGEAVGAVLESVGLEGGPSASGGDGAAVSGYGDTSFVTPNASAGRSMAAGQSVTTGGSGIDSTVLKHMGTTHYFEGDVVWRFEGPKRTVELRVPAGVLFRIRDAEARQLQAAGALEIPDSWRHALNLRVPYLTDGLVAEPVEDGLWLHGDDLPGDAADLLQDMIDDADANLERMRLTIGGPTGEGRRRVTLDDVTSFVDSLPSAARAPALTVYQQVGDEEVALPQALADHYGRPVTATNGTVGPGNNGVLQAFVEDGAGAQAWTPVARLLEYRPGAPASQVVEVQDIGDWLEPDTPTAEDGRLVPLGDAHTAEVVQSGYWVRDAAEPAAVAAAGVRTGRPVPDGPVLSIGTPGQQVTAEHLAAARALYERLTTQARGGLWLHLAGTATAEIRTQAEQLAAALGIGVRVDPLVTTAADRPTTAAAGKLLGELPKQVSAEEVEAAIRRWHDAGYNDPGAGVRRLRPDRASGRATIAWPEGRRGGVPQAADRSRAGCDHPEGSGREGGRGRRQGPAQGRRCRQPPG